ncbi:MAG: sugar ABC transporter ATP-binding protein [Clostridiales bacterium]|nr:sugar ABC transporter ATP-binding protein [Clostridiales bacterium]
MKYLEVRSVVKNFGGIQALTDGNLSCDRGTVCGLLGANGSGKSTLSNIIAGLVKPNGGEIFIDGKPAKIHNSKDAQRNGIAMVHQNLSLIPELTVWENISLGHEALSKGRALDNRKSQAKATEMVEKLCPEVSIFEKIKALSPAQKQLVEIAKAVSHPDIRILIMDEPTAALELHQCERVFELVENIKAQGVAVIFISHRLWEVLRICDMIVVFRSGASVANIDFSEEERDEGKIVSLITGKEHGQIFARAKEDKQGGETLMEIKGLTSGDRLKETNITLKAGEILGLGGLQGQGQEDLLMILSGLVAPDSGEVRLNGEAIRLNSTKEMIDRGVVLVPGDRHEEGLFLNHTVNFNLRYPSSAQDKSGPFVNLKKENSDSAQKIRDVSLIPPDGSIVVRSLSGGNQQKVVIGKWLGIASSVLLLSDPTKGVDVGARSEIYSIIADMAKQGIGVILYASDNGELMSVCDRILIMFEGSVVEEIVSADFAEERIIAASLRTTTERVEQEFLSEEVSPTC